MPLPYTPTVYFLTYDRWGHGEYGQQAAAVDGTYSFLAPVGHTNIYSFSGYSHFLTPTAVDITVPSGGVTGRDFTWIALGTIYGLLRTGDGQIVYGWNTLRFTNLPDPSAAWHVWVYLDPANMPREVMLQFHIPETNDWEHRAYWGENLFGWGSDGTQSRLRLGGLPAGGQWIELVVPASAVGVAGANVDGLAFVGWGGRLWWDDVTLTSDVAAPYAYMDDALPPGASPASEYETAGWAWDTSVVHSGTQSHISTGYYADYYHQQYFTGAPWVAIPGSRTYTTTSYYYDGSYSIDVIPGSYRIDPPNVDPYGPVPPQTVTVAAGQSVQANFVYRLEGTLAGLVTDDAAAPAPLAGVQVCDERGNCGLTDATGHYQFAVPAGSRTVVPQRFVIGYAVVDRLGPFDVAVNATVTVPTIVYHRNGSVSGVVRDDLGNGLPGVTIAFAYRDPVGNALLRTYTATSDTGGAYTLSVPYGSRIVVAQPLAGYSIHGADTVTVDVATAGSVDFAYDKWGGLGGTLLDRQGNPVAGVSISACAFECSFTTSAADGTYTFASLRPANYSVTPGGKTGFVTPAARTVTIPARTPAVADFQYVKLAHLTGHVQDDAGTALASVSLCLSGACFSTDAKRQLRGLRPGRQLHADAADVHRRLRRLCHTCCDAVHRRGRRRAPVRRRLRLHPPGSAVRAGRRAVRRGADAAALRVGLRLQRHDAAHAGVDGLRPDLRQGRNRGAVRAGRHRRDAPRRRPRRLRPARAAGRREDVHGLRRHALAAARRVRALPLGDDHRPRRRRHRRRRGRDGDDLARRLRHDERGRRLHDLQPEGHRRRDAPAGRVAHGRRAADGRGHVERHHPCRLHDQPLRPDRRRRPRQEREPAARRGHDRRLRRRRACQLDDDGRRPLHDRRASGRRGHPGRRRHRLGSAGGRAPVTFAAGPTGVGRP